MMLYRRLVGACFSTRLARTASSLVQRAHLTIAHSHSGKRSIVSQMICASFGDSKTPRLKSWTGVVVVL
jgi:hypothetical protein